MTEPEIGARATADLWFANPSERFGPAFGETAALRLSAKEIRAVAA
jgi:hypothetical protein